MDHRGTCISDSDNPCIRGDIYRDKDTSFEKINQFEKSQKLNIGHSCQGCLSKLLQIIWTMEIGKNIVQIIPHTNFSA